MHDTCLLYQDKENQKNKQSIYLLGDETDSVLPSGINKKQKLKIPSERHKETSLGP